jgi:hypothetical protein
MATKKSRWILFGILVISALVLGSAIYVGAETLSYKLYTWVIKSETVPIGDVEGHTVALTVRGSFYVFENGEVATGYAVVSGDRIGVVGSYSQYTTVTFSDGSTIIRKDQGTTGGGTTPGVYRAGGFTSEIIKGTGRFEGIKGTHAAKLKYLPIEKWEAGPKGIGEGTFTYTLPSK